MAERPSKRPNLDGATVLITGASSGIGAEFARQLAPRAKALVIVARREERLRELAAELTAAHPKLTVDVQRCDLTDLGAVDSMLASAQAAVGDIDILINNAGFGHMAHFIDSPLTKLERMIALNVTAPTYLAHKLAQGMVARQSGGILNISSGFGLVFMPGFATYVGTKHYLSGFSESLRAELRGQGVAVTHVCPGPVETEFSSVAGSNPDDMPAFVRIDAAKCARVSLKAFARGKAMVVPGGGMKGLMGLVSATPRWLIRLAVGAAAPNPSAGKPTS